MTIIVVENTKMLPNVKLRCYQLNKHYTEADAIEDYQERYRITPERGWKWASYLYFEEPEK